MVSDSPSGIDRIDPICGRRLGEESPHRLFHGGVVFQFCSNECCGRFASVSSIPGTDSASADDGVAMPAAGASAGRGGMPMFDPEAAGVAQALASPPDPDDGRANDLAVGPTAIEEKSSADAAQRHSASEHGETSARRALHMRALRDWAKAGALDVFAPFFAWRERRFAAACCREMLKLYRTAAAIDPGLAGPRLYHRVVAARSGRGPSDADAILERAEQSFASWPAPRSLNFRDVVHYMAAQEFSSSHKNARWIHANMTSVVNDWIPRDL